MDTYTYEALLAEQPESFAALHDRYGEYAKYVFRSISLRELSEFPPAQREQVIADNELNKLFGDGRLARQVLDFHTLCEKHRVLREGAEDSEDLPGLLEILRAWESAPLVAELPFNGALAFWKLAGSWMGALTLAGLEPHNSTAHKFAKKRYLLANMRADALSEKIKKMLTATDLAELDGIFEKARKSGTNIIASELTALPCAESFAEHGLNIVNYLKKAGLPVVRDGYVQPAVPKKNFKKWAGYA